MCLISPLRACISVYGRLAAAAGLMEIVLDHKFLLGLAGFPELPAGGDPPPYSARLDHARHSPHPDTQGPAGHRGAHNASECKLTESGGELVRLRVSGAAVAPAAAPPRRRAPGGAAAAAGAPARDGRVPVGRLRRFVANCGHASRYTDL